MIVTATTLTTEYKEAILQLWNSEYPAQLQHADVASLDNYLGGLADVTHYFLMIDGAVAVWAETFMRDGEKWFAIIANREMQGKGYGKEMMNMLLQKEPVLFGWVTDHDRYKKADGSAYTSPLGFYKQLGFVVTDERLETEKLSAVRIVWKR